MRKSVGAISLSSDIFIRSGCCALLAPRQRGRRLDRALEEFTAGRRFGSLSFGCPLFFEKRQPNSEPVCACLGKYAYAYSDGSQRASCSRCNALLAIRIHPLRRGPSLPTRNTRLKTRLLTPISRPHDYSSWEDSLGSSFLFRFFFQGIKFIDGVKETNDVA